MFSSSGERFRAFNDNLVAILNSLDAQNATIVLDNAPVHRGAVAESNDGDIHVRFLPAYSPFLNPIESAFNVFKQKLRALLREDTMCNRIATVPAHISTAEHRLRVLHELSTTVIEDQETISGEKVANMCTHVMRYMHRSLAMADICV